MPGVATTNILPSRRLRKQKFAEDKENENKRVVKRQKTVGGYSRYDFIRDSDKICKQLSSNKLFLLIKLFLPIQRSTNQ